jgi:tetratricopeptide (TPR) repeat protein
MLGDPALIARCLDALVYGLMEDGDRTGLYQKMYEEGLALAQSAGDVVSQANMVRRLGNLALMGGDLGRAEMRYEESLALYQQAGDQRGIAQALFCLGEVAGVRGEYRQAHDRYRASLAIRRTLGEAPGICFALYRLGCIATVLGDYDAARRTLEESLHLARQLGMASQYSSLFTELANVSLAEGKLEQATMFGGEAVTHAVDPINKQMGLRTLGHVARAQDHLPEAMAHYREGLSLAHGRHQLEAVVNLTNMGVTACVMGDPVRGVRLCAAAATAYENFGGCLAAVAAVECPGYERIVTETRDALGDEAFMQLWAEGQALQFEQALAEALGAVHQE